jgi:Zn-dependent protease with chaperone function
MSYRKSIGIGLFALMAMVACAARKPGSALQPGFNLFSKQQDIQLGQQAEQQVLQQYQQVRNPVLEDFVQRVGERLAQTPEARNSGFQFRYYVLNANEVNAFALPGGPVNVFTGLIKETDNEGEFAGVLAHEMSHVILRHGTNQASKANLMQIPAALAGAALGGGAMGQLAQVGLGLGLNGLFLKYSRTDESQADALGTRLMAEAGYNPIEMADFFEKLQAKGGAGVPQFLSDHPNPGNRVKAVQQEIQGLPHYQYGFATGEFQQAKAQVGQLPPPPKNPRQTSQGPINTDGASSGVGYQRLQTQRFTMEYPNDWQVYGDQQSSSITIAPRQGIVQGGNGGAAVGLGAIVSYFFPESQNENLSQATADLVHHLHSENPGMQESSGQRRVRVGGSTGIATQLTSNSPFGGAENDILVTAARPEGVFYVVLIAPERNWSELQPVFGRMLDSIRFQ